MMADEQRVLSGRAAEHATVARAGELEEKRVLLFLGEGFEDLEAVAALSVLGWSAYRPSVATVSVRTAGLRPEVRGAFGTSFKVDLVLEGVSADERGEAALEPPSSEAVMSVANANGSAEAVSGGLSGETAICSSYEDNIAAGFDALVVPGGFHNFGYDEVYCETVYALVRAFRAQGKPVATMCVGAVLVADSGALEGGRATTYRLSSRHDNAGRLVRGGCEVVDEPVVEWNGIITCSGPAHAEEVLARLLARLVGLESAAEIARYRSGLK